MYSGERQVSGKAGVQPGWQEWAPQILDSMGQNFGDEISNCEASSDPFFGRHHRIEGLTHVIGDLVDNPWPQLNRKVMAHAVDDF